MRDHEGDPRVVARESGGWDVTTSQGVRHVLDSGLLRWGAFQGPDLAIAPTADGQLAIGAADPQELIRALLDSDTAGDGQGHAAAAETTVVAEPADEDVWEA